MTRMIKKANYIEIQSPHVKDYINEFINIKNKNFFIKNDFVVSEKIYEDIKTYNFKKKINFLYIIGPHFNLPHKNIVDFIDVMTILKETTNIQFEISITLSKNSLHSYKFWNKKLDTITNFFGYLKKEEVENLFTNNSILISNSIIETLGLHVIEAIKNGIITIVPNEKYSTAVYGEDILTYQLFNKNSLANKIKSLIQADNTQIKNIIKKNQKFLINTKKNKYDNINNIIEKVLTKEYTENKLNNKVIK